MSAIQDGLTSLWDVLDMKTSLLGLTAAYAAWRVYVVVSGLRVCPAIIHVCVKSLEAYLLLLSRDSMAYQEYILHSIRSLFSEQLCLSHLGTWG